MCGPLTGDRGKVAVSLSVEVAISDDKSVQVVNQLKTCEDTVYQFFIASAVSSENGFGHCVEVYAPETAEVVLNLRKRLCDT